LRHVSGVNTEAKALDAIIDAIPAARAVLERRKRSIATTKPEVPARSFQTHINY
jgi:hypothetical protein